jgi:hypothetical protein
MRTLRALGKSNGDILMLNEGLRIAYGPKFVEARWSVGDCSKSKKLKKQKKPDLPKFECGKCGLAAEDKKHVCKPTKVKKKDKKKAKK